MMKVIKRILCQFLIVAMWVGVTHAAGEGEAVPVLEVEEGIYDFRQVTQGDVVKHDFRIFNRGDAPLEIKSVRPG
jgi:hypothetical protein